jgi:pimeloyl-ACP methyl ester carboxylesterase
MRREGRVGTEPARRRARLRRAAVLGFGMVAVLVAGWTWWAEQHPRDERRLRGLVHDQLDAWFPEQMAPDDGWHGLHRRNVGSAAALPVVLIHGLDEPGIIWDDLIPALDSAGFEVWEFRYPNDQGLDRSAAYLAEQWPALNAARPVALVGHSMGGLVIREFVSRWRHPVDQPAPVEGAPVAGALLVATPNHGSEWARLRIWLELRDLFPNDRGKRFSLFAALRDGTGEAKIDLRPQSDFLRALNARPWPESVPIALIGARLLGPADTFIEGIEEASAEVGSPELRAELRAWWSSLGDEVGDGVVTLESLALSDAPPPIIVDGAHRTMLRRLLPGDPEPPAIAPILAVLRGWDAAREAAATR